MFNYLPKDSFFNVTIFGTDYEDIFPYPLRSDSQNLNKAIQFILNKATANKGNTDLLNFIQNEDRLNLIKSYVLISDGHMTRSSELISYLSKNNKNRIFTCSIGNLTNNNHLLKLIANITKSHYDFYDDKNQRKWKEKIEDLMDKIQQPTALSDIYINWQNFSQINDENFDYNYAPNKINCLFNGRRVLAYGFMPNCQQAILKASINGYEFETLVTCPELMITRGDLIHKLTAKALIDDWQNGILCSDDKIQNDLQKQKLKSKIIRLSKKFSITSEYTSFVAIEDRDKNESSSDQIQIKDLLEKNDQSLDILPYMAYETSHISKEDLILDEIDLRDRVKLFEFYRLNEELIDSNELKNFMANEYRKRLIIEKALKIYKSCEKNDKIDQIIEELENFRSEISIKMLTGRTIYLQLDEGMTVENLKSFIQDKEGIPIDQQSLISLGKQLDRGLLSDLGISHGSVIHLVLRLRGGPVECQQDNLIKQIPKFQAQTKSLSFGGQQAQKDIFPLAPSPTQSLSFGAQMLTRKCQAERDLLSLDAKSNTFYTIPSYTKANICRPRYKNSSRACNQAPQQSLSLAANAMYLKPKKSFLSNSGLNRSDRMDLNDDDDKTEQLLEERLFEKSVCFSDFLDLEEKCVTLQMSENLFEKIQCGKKENQILKKKQNITKVLLSFDLNKKKIKIIDTLKALDLGIYESFQEVKLSLIVVSNYIIKFNNYDIDCKPLIDFFVSLGVNSLGEQASCDIKELIIDMVILVIVLFIFNKEEIKISCFEQLRDTIKKVLKPIHYNSYNLEFVNHVFDYMRRVQHLQLKYPNACDILEVERNWDKFLENWLLTD